MKRSFDSAYPQAARNFVKRLETERARLVKVGASTKKIDKQLEIQHAQIDGRLVGPSVSVNVKLKRTS